MIVIDFSAIALASVFALKSNKIDEDFIRHMILNSLRMYNLKYRDKYGKMIIACDGGSWRKEVFKEYKAGRAKGREESDLDWDEVWRVMNLVREEITEFLPYSVVQVKGAEADDVIATMVARTQEFGQHEDVMIISSDKDFIQLQQYSNVSQFSPMKKKLITDKNPKRYLMEHVFRGDGGDGVPNVLSDDDTFVNETKRQTPLKAKVIEEWVKQYDNLEKVMDEKTYRNFCRNRRVIDLSYIPDHVATAINNSLESQPQVGNNKVLNYLIAKRCRQLVGSASEFFEKK